MTINHSSTIKTLVQHLKKITGDRDHTLLDVAVVAALHELLGASQARVLKISQYGQKQFIQPQVWIDAGQVVSMEESLDAKNRGDEMSSYPCLVDCLERRLPKVEETTVAGDRITWLPGWINEKAQTCLEVTNLQSYSIDSLQIMDGIISVYRSYQSLLDYSERDSLTGLLNRKTFDDKFSRIVSSGPSVDRTSSQEDVDCWDHPTNKKDWIAVLDIDHFKRVNDQFGHLYGDEVLILVANLMNASFRTYDRIFRFGGEEFVVLVRSVTIDEARKVLNRFRRNVEEYDFPQVGRVTISIGFSAISEVPPNMLLGDVDQALYYAKEHGRNQVCQYEELMARGIFHREEPQGDAEFF